MVNLERKAFTIPTTYRVGDETALSFWGGQEIKYTIVS